MIKTVLTLIMLTVPSALLADQGKAACRIIEGSPAVKLCTFEIENSPACHKLEDYPQGPDQLASFYGATVASYKYDPNLGGFVLTIVRAMSDGKLGSIALFHKGMPNTPVEPGTEACIVAIGSQVAGDPA